MKKEEDTKKIAQAVSQSYQIKVEAISAAIQMYGEHRQNSGYMCRNIGSLFPDISILGIVKIFDAIKKYGDFREACGRTMCGTGAKEAAEHIENEISLLSEEHRKTGIDNV